MVVVNLYGDRHGTLMLTKASNAEKEIEEFLEIT